MEAVGAHAPGTIDGEAADGAPPAVPTAVPTARTEPRVALAGGSPFAAMRLTELLAEVQTRLDLIASAQQRVQDLLDAFLTVSTGLDLESTLERIVQAAATLVDARYGALGVLRPDGEGLDPFVTVGMEAAGIEHAGNPHGKGILGRLIADPRPLRLADLTDHPSSVGIPAGHPAMRTFLGVPIRAHGRVFGNLYLTEKRGGQFTEQDEVLLTALAGAAGIAIENARAFREGELRERWLAAAGEVRTVLDAFGAEAALQIVADRVLHLAGADGVWLLRDVDGERGAFRVVAVAGPGVDDCTGARIGPGDCDVLSALQGSPAALVDLATRAWPDPDAGWGPAIAARLRGNDSGSAVLLAARSAGGPAFEPYLTEMVGSFAAQVALALDADTRQQVVRRLDLFEERDRIGRDLHDHVLQRLFATGMGMQALSARISDPAARDKLRELVGQLDQTVRDIRTSIFDLHTADDEASATSLRRRLLDVVRSTGGDLHPVLRVSGPLDTVVTGALAADVEAVVREGVSNAVRHARARSVTVTVEAADEVVVEIRDDGIGIPDRVARSGLRNLEERARRSGGGATVERVAAGGTVLRWHAPL